MFLSIHIHNLNVDAKPKWHFESSEKQEKL